MAPSTGFNPVLKYISFGSASPLVCRWHLQVPTLFLLMILTSFSTISLANSDNPSSIETAPPSPTSITTTDQKLLIVIGCVSVFAFLALLFMAYRKCFGLKMGRRSNGVAGDQVLPTTHEPFECRSPQDPMGKSRVRRYSWEEIQKATNNFNLVIGEGGFSTVYLGSLPDSSSSAAYKVYRTSERLHRAFQQELQVLMNTHHPNIVRLLGYSDQTGEGVLVFEYVSNGSLHEKLHSHGNGMILSWAQRMTIAGQLAGAVNHLHENRELQIVHGDIKTSNVLIDGQLNGMLSDFGAAKMGFSAAILPSSASPLSTKMVVGSPGYVDPHYVRTGIMSKKSDVYSFGVLLLELVTGMEAFHEVKGRLTLSGAVRNVLGEPERVAEVVDGRLRGEYDVGEAAAVVALAADCLREQPSLRPAMADVMLTLNEKVHSANTGHSFVDKSKQ